MAACDPAAGGPEVTLADLLAEMTDLTKLAELPAPAYTSRFVSSRDPRSDGAAPGSAEWFANADYIGLARDETKTLLEVEGPGVLTRFWSASPKGTVRVYLDGSDEPAIEADFADLLEGAIEPFEPPFAFVAAGGRNLYFPIPFARSCRVTLTGPVDRSYYHISYRSYANDVAVEPYGDAALAASEATRACVAASLSALRADSAVDARGLTRERFTLDSAAPDDAAVISAPRGGRVRQIWVRPDSSDPALLRGTVLSIAFDGTETVRVPLGDFFASGVARGEVAALPIGASPGDPLTARWTMPFAREARLSLAETSAGTLRADVELVWEPAAFTERSLYFHAGWRAPETFPSKPSRDWTLAELDGQGLYVGNVLNVVNRNTQWWGEGDEHIYVDGEATPSHFGTGTEDYYGYAWCSNARFTTPYIGQPLAGKRRSFGQITLYRFHVLDPIPFTSSLRFDFEVQHWGEPVDVTYDAVTFWYARPGSQWRGPVPPADAYRIPQLGVPAPNLPDEPYRCGG